jgi:hypothetical protein
MKKPLLASLVAVIATVGISSTAWALDCHNVSRNVSSTEMVIATTGTPYLAFPIGVDPSNSQPIFWNIMPDFKGNWYLLTLTEGSPVPTGTVIDVWWGFIPPGSVPGPLPGGNGSYHGNYTNGKVDDLLGMAACPVARQDIHGIQSGACD